MPDGMFESMTWGFKEATRKTYCQKCGMFISKGEKMFSIENNLTRGRDVNLCRPCSCKLRHTLLEEVMPQKKKIKQKRTI